LTGLVKCSTDGERMVGHRTKNLGYECVVCHQRIAAERLDAYVTELVLSKLSTPRLAERLAAARSDRKESDALRDLDRADKRLGELASMFGAGDLEPAEYRAGREAAQERRADAERRLSSRRSSRVLGDVLASPDGIREVWERQEVPWRREVIRAVLDQVKIGASTRSAWEPERVRIAWRA
jgi:hypothetical protein